MSMTDTATLTLSKQELARELKLSVRSVERMRKAGTLPPTIPGVGRPRWARAVVVEWLRASGERR